MYYTLIFVVETFFSIRLIYFNRFYSIYFIHIPRTEVKYFYCVRGKKRFVISWRVKYSVILKNALRVLKTISATCVPYQAHWHGELISRKIARLITIIILFLHNRRKGGGI